MNVIMTVSNAYTFDPRVKHEAESLVKAGHKVKVIAWDRRGEFPQRETISGVEVIRIRNTPIMKLSSLDIVRLWFWQSIAADVIIDLLKNTDVIHCHDYDSLAIGVEIKDRIECTNYYGGMIGRAKKTVKLIYDAHEIWGYMVAKDLPWWNRYIEKEKKLIAYADELITVCEPLAEYYGKIYKKPITIIMNAKNYINEEYSNPTEPEFTICYAGTLGESRQIVEMIDAISKIDNVRFMIAGTGKKEYVDKIKEHCNKTKNAKFIGRVPQQGVISVTKKCHAGICLLGNGTISNKLALPNKIFESMVAGRPLFTTKGLYYSNFAEELGFGIPVSSVEDCINSIKNLSTDPEKCKMLGLKALEAAKTYNWENEEKKLFEVYNRMDITKNK